MTEPESVQARKDAAARGATGNHGIGLDGDGPSAADIRDDSVTDPEPDGAGSGQDAGADQGIGGNAQR